MLDKAESHGVVLVPGIGATEALRAQPP